MIAWLLWACHKAPVPAPAEPVSEAHFVGAAACSGCHPDSDAAWQDSAHAHALTPLREAGRSNDPSCLLCHTTGFARPSGFGSGGDNALLASVGCESCHGPGSLHQAQPALHPLRASLSAESCQSCHTVDNSPDFELASYWSRIVH